MLLWPRSLGRECMLVRGGERGEVEEGMPPPWEKPLLS